MHELLRSASKARLKALALGVWMIKGPRPKFTEEDHFGHGDILFGLFANRISENVGIVAMIFAAFHFLVESNLGEVFGLAKALLRSTRLPDPLVKFP
jgi:hypothetical protein